MELGKGMDVIKRREVKVSLYTKLNGLIVILFIPIFLMYSYSDRVSVGVISREIQDSNFNQLSFLSSQIESRIQQMMDFSIMFSQDSTVKKFNGLSVVEDPYERMQTRYSVQEKINLQSGVQNIWPVQYSVYSRNNKDVISNAFPVATYSDAYLVKYVTNRWVHRISPTTKSEDAFYWYMTDSIGTFAKMGSSNIVIEASFSDRNIENMLVDFKSSGRGDPFFYHKGDEPLVNRTADMSLIQELKHYLDKQPLQETFNQTVKLQNKEYLVSAVISPQLGWYLVDYVPLEQILDPISVSRGMFYISMVLLLVLGFSASVLLYRHVQRPIKKLMNGMKSVRKGDFSARITMDNERNEFSFLFHRFNEMSKQIEELIENAYNEKIRAREATLKQLQAQINPHFLYNCLGFIINMAQLKDEQAVVSMAYNLSGYYRYTTRLEKQTATVKEEVQLIVNYLDIQKLRNERIHYQINIPDEMMSIPIPRLLLQPIVENAVIHGINNSYTSGEIQITGQIVDGTFTLFIDDDGEGMLPEALIELNCKMLEPLQEEMGCGLWNVSQRMVYQFGEDAFLRLLPSPLGGLRAVVKWKLPLLESDVTDRITKGD